MGKINIDKLFIETPLVFSDPISRILGSNVHLKMEALQPSGSFKNRGIGNYCSKHAENGATQFISSSGGNAGLAAAFAARYLKTPITVVLPKSTPSMMIDKIKDQEALVIQHGVDWQEADNYACTLAKKHNACYIPPFDHPLIWDGNATLIHEVAASGWKPDAVILSIGGGGLFCGALQGMHDVGWVDTPVYAVETTGSASFSAAIRAGEIVKIDTINTVAKSLGARSVSEQALKWSQMHPVHSKVVSDYSAVSACQRFMNDHRLLIEPACGAALSLCYNLDQSIKLYNNILVVVCGGAAVSPELLSKWLLETKKDLS